MLALGLYEVIKFFHVLLAIVAVGFNATYGIWLARAAKEPEHEAFTLGGVNCSTTGSRTRPTPCCW